MIHERDITGQHFTCKALTQHGFTCDHMATKEITHPANGHMIRLCAMHTKALYRNTILPLTGRQVAVIVDGVSAIAGGMTP